MKLKITFLLLCLIAISGCDKPDKTPKSFKPPWGKWLQPDATHQDKRLEVQFGDAIYQIPVTYLSGKGSQQKLHDFSYMRAGIAASYPDLVPVHKMHEKNIPNYPLIYVVLSGHKDDPDLDSYRVNDWQERLKDLHQKPFSTQVCQGPVVSVRASGMNEYVCESKGLMIYISPLDSAIKTPSGHDLYIRCNDSNIPGARYECSISSPLFTDRRGVFARMHLNDLSNLLDVYHKTIELLTSLESSRKVSHQPS